MKRYWDVDLLGNPLTGPVNVRFFYDTADVNALNNLAQSFATTNGASLEPAIWFKTTSGAFVPNGTNVTPEAVQNAIGLVNANGANAQINGVFYAQFNGVSSFSGGTYSTGAGPNIGTCPLANTSYLSNISGTTYQWQLSTDGGNTWGPISNGAVYGGTTLITLTLTAPPTSYNTYQYRCLVDGTTFSNTFIYRAGVYWTGAVSNVWTNPLNWSCGAMPDANTDVYIIGPVPFYPLVSTNVTIRSLKANPASAVTVSPGFSITLTGQ